MEDVVIRLQLICKKCGANQEALCFFRGGQKLHTVNVAPCADCGSVLLGGVLGQKLTLTLESSEQVMTQSVPVSITDLKKLEELKKKHEAVSGDDAKDNKDSENYTEEDLTS